jgi:hypothetical protein
VQEGRSASSPFGYQYIGRMEVEGRLTVHLAKGEKLYPVRVGDVLDGVFRVEGIKTDGLELTYLPQKSKQFVAFSAIAPPTPQANVAARPEAQPQQPRAPINPLAVPIGPGVPPAPTAGNAAAPPGAGRGTPVGGPAATTTGSPNMPSVGGEPGAPAPSPTAEAAPGTPMSISPPVSHMPVEPPTVSTMPTLPPENEPSGATMATTPPSGGM